MSDRMSQEEYVRMIIREEAPGIIAEALTREDDLEKAAERLRVGVDGATRLTDEQLVTALSTAVRELVVGDGPRDHFYTLIGEACERWAPEAEWAANLRERQENHDAREDEVESDHEGRENRKAMREGAVL